MKATFRLLTVLLVLSVAIGACAPATTPAPAPAQQPTTAQSSAVSQPTPAPVTTPTTAPVAVAAQPTNSPQPTKAAAGAATGADKVLKVHLYEDIQNLDPAFYPSDADESVMVNIYQGLIAYKPGTWEVTNVLAESITPSKDGLTIDFKLREGVQFHGGFGELTADDVKFSYERIADPKNQAVYAGDWAALDHVEVTGKYTGKIILKEPFAAMWTQTLPLTSGWLLSKKADEKRELKVWATQPVGTGPYEFVEWKPNQKVELKRFKDYWGEKPYYDTIIHQYIPEESAVEVALETGELDFGRIPPASVARFASNPKFKVVTVPTLDWEFLPINVQHPKLKDPNIRKAIRYAIDVDAINTAAYEDKYQPLCGMLVPGQIGYWKDAPCYKRDLAKAQEYLAKAGVKDLELTLAIQNTETEKAVGEIIQANLAEIGIKVKLDIQDDAAFVDGGMGDKGLQERQLVYLNFVNFPDPSGESVWFTCAQVKQWNWSYWCNENFDKLHADALKEQDPAKRQTLYVEMQKLMDDDAIVVWMSQITMFYIAKADIAPSIMPHGRVLPWNFSPVK